MGGKRKRETTYRDTVYPADTDVFDDVVHIPKYARTASTDCSVSMSDLPDYSLMAIAEFLFDHLAWSLPLLESVVCGPSPLAALASVNKQSHQLLSRRCVAWFREQRMDVMQIAAFRERLDALCRHNPKRVFASALLGCNVRLVEMATSSLEAQGGPEIRMCSDMLKRLRVSITRHVLSFSVANTRRLLHWLRPRGFVDAFALHGFVDLLTYRDQGGHKETLEATEKVRLLREMDVDVDVKDADGYTCLMHAIQSERLDIVQALLKAGVAPLLDVAFRLAVYGFPDNKNGTDRMVASEFYEQCAGMLQKHGARVLLIPDPTTMPRLWKTQARVLANPSMTNLMLAVIRGNVHAVRLLLAAQADTKARSDRCWTAFMYAIRYGRSRCLDLLLEANPTLDVHEDRQTVVRYLATKKELHLRPWLVAFRIPSLERDLRQLGIDDIQDLATMVSSGGINSDINPTFDERQQLTSICEHMPYL